uniref:Fibronectin type-III domain-containing protein n=1 Tax=Elaeophora elaphi TaxID=1147741 RepID=A0A158Q6S8_9BILA
KPKRTGKVDEVIDKPKETEKAVKKAKKTEKTEKSTQEPKETSNNSDNSAMIPEQKMSEDIIAEGEDIFAVESWCAISEPGTEFDIHLPGLKAFLTKEATVSLCVEKVPECGFIDTIPASPDFYCCSLFVELTGLRKTAIDRKGRMEKPVESGLMRAKHTEEIPVETVSVSFEFTKQRTQKIGVGTIFNSERPTEQIELAEEIIRPSPHGETVGIFALNEKSFACMSFYVGDKTYNDDITAVDIDRTVSEMSRRQSKERSTSVIADIEVDAGEELATTDAIVDILSSFEGTELVINEFASDILDVDVTLDALMEEEFIEAIGPFFHKQYLLRRNCVTDCTVCAQCLFRTVSLVIRAISQSIEQSLENLETDRKLEDVGKESQDIDEEKKEKPKEGAEKRKKKVPKALVIPAEISSKYGDKSTLLSETIMTTEIAMNEEMAEVETSPRKCLSASVAMKVDSAKSRKSVTRRTSSVENFTFKDIEKEAKTEVVEESVKKARKRSGLPPLPKAISKIDDEFVFEQKEYQENTEDTLRVKVIEELAITVAQAIGKSRKKKVEEAERKDSEEKKQGKKSIEELEKVETIELAPTIKDGEKQKAYERTRKKRIGFIQAPDKEIIAFRGDTIKIECELVNNDDFTWFINGKPASKDLRCTEEANLLVRRLIIENITLEDNDKIIVAKVGDIIAETTIHVEDTPAEIIEPLPRRSFGKCGEDVTLAVFVTHPAHSIVWEFKGEKLSEDDENYVIAGEGSVYRLTIKNATYDHAGRYSINVDSLETSTTLVMQGAPIIEKQEPESVDFEAHENLRLNIPYKAVPEPTVDCFFNNEPLLVGTKLNLEVINDVVQFCKRKTTKNDSGEYAFKIRNEFGEAIKTFNVNVKAIQFLEKRDDKNEKLEWTCWSDISCVPENLRIMNVSCDKASIEWDAPKDDGGSKIIGYVIQKKEIGRRTFHHVIQVTDDKTNYLIEDLEADSEYIFRVAAINKYGTGEFAEFPIAHTCVAPEESEEIPEEKMELEKVPETIDGEQEVTELEKPKVKKTGEKSKSKKTEQLEEEMKEEESEETEKDVEITDLKESIETTKDLEQHGVSEFDVEKVAETLVESREEEVKDEILPMDKEKAEKLDTTEAEKLKPKKTKRKKSKKEEKPSEEIQRKSVEAIESLVENKSDKALEKANETIDDRIPLKKEKAANEEIKLNRKKSEDKAEAKEKIATSVTEEGKFEEKADKKVSQEEKKPVEVTAEFEVEESFEIKHEKEKEVDVDEVSGTVKLGKKAEEVALEEEPAHKGKKEIKKKKLSKEKGRQTTVKKVEKLELAAVEKADENLDVQFQEQDVVAEEIKTSDKVKIEAEKEEVGKIEEEKEVKKDNLKEELMEDKSKVKTKKEHEEKKKKTGEVVSIDISFKNTPNAENVDKVISTLRNKEVISTTVKAALTTKKSKMPKKLVKEKPEEIIKTEQEEPKAEKVESKLEMDEKVEKSKPEKEKDEKDTSKRLESEQAEQKPLEDKEVKPKKKVAGKKVSKKTLQKPKAEKKIEKESMDEDVKKVKDETQHVRMKEESVGEEKVNEITNEEVEKLDSSAAVDVTVSIPIPISEVPEPEDTVGTVTLSWRDSRRVHKRPSGFAFHPEQEILAFRNDTVKIECEVLNEEDKLNWTINGKPATVDKRCTEIVNGYLRILQIENVVPEDTDTIVTANIDEHSAESRLIIEDIPVEIIEKLQRKITGKVNDSVKLSITVSHSSENCQWFFNNEQLIENNDHYEVTVEGNVCNLLIKNLTYDQTGRYSAKVDCAETSAILTVEGAPMLNEIETIATMVDLESQDNLVLMVPFKAVPEPTLECLLNNEKIPWGSKVQLDIFNDKVCFCKRKVDKSDAGEYTIKIINDYGEVSQTFSVNIRDVPEAPENGRITDIGSSHARVHWDAPSDDGGSAITGYVVERREESRRTYHRVAQISNEVLDYYMDDLKMDTTYMIRIAAMNKYGTGEYLECRSFQTGLPFQAPSVTHPPTISNVTDQNCTLKWERLTEDGGSPIYGYDIFVRKDGSDWVKVNDELVFTEQFVVSNLESGPTYEFKMEATNEAGFTSESNIVSEPLKISKAAELPVLSPPKVEIVSNNAVRVQWIEVTDESCNVTSYVMKYKSENASVWSEKEIEHSPADITDLKEGLSYLFKVAPKIGPAIGEFSEETMPIRVIAAKKPEITKGIKDVSVPRKRELKLECHASGEPAPQYIWCKNGQEIIPANENTEIVNEGCMSVLLIHHTSTEDGGLYRCEVINDYGSADSEANVTITEVRAHFVSSFPEYLEIDEGEEIEFSCELSDADASVVWLKDGKPLSPGDRIMIKEDVVERKLTIRNSVLEDSGKYVCSTIDKKTQSEAELIVKEELPHINRGPQDQVVTEFDATVVLKCETTKPVKAVKWFQNKKEIWPRQEKYSMNVEGTVAILTIMHFGLNDCGEYTAVLRDDEESAPAKVELKIPPTIKLSKSLPCNVLKLHCGTDFDIEFDYGGFPEVDITTTINGKPLDKMRSRLHTFNNKLSLRLKKVIQEDSGVLKVVVENKIGSASAEIQLDVIDVPSKPSSLISCNITSRSMMLKWEQAEDNGSPITNYIVERRTSVINRWRNIGKCEPEECEFLVEDLYPNESYSFRIVAVNEVGAGAPSDIVDIVTMNESIDLEERTSILLVPNCLEAALTDDSKTVLITWEKVKEAEEYIIEKSKGENDWKQIGAVIESKFEDSFDKSSSNKYRVIAKRGELLSSPSEEMEIVTFPDRIKKEEEQSEVTTAEVLQEISEMIETKQQEMEEQKSEEPSDQAEQAKVGKKVSKKKKKEDKEGEKISNGIVAVVEKSEGKPEEHEIKASEKAEAETVMEEKKQEEEQKDEIEIGKKIADDMKPSEKVVEENEEKVETKKIAKKKAQKKKKKEVEKEEISKDEIEVSKNFEEEKIKSEMKSGVALEQEKEKHGMKSEGKIETVKKPEGGKVDDEKVLNEESLGKKLEEKLEEKVIVEQKTELFEIVEVEPEKDSEKKIEEKANAEAKEDGKLIKKKKKAKSKQEMKETVEQKLYGSISEEAVSNELLVTEKKKDERKEEETVMQTEKLEVRTANDSVTINYGTKGCELSMDIHGNFLQCFWTKDEKAVDKKLVKTMANSSILYLENVDELTAGLYRCTITNKTEKATAEIRVTVADKPTIEFEETMVGIKASEMLKIHANVRGLPVPTCKWLKDGVELKTDDNTNITFKEGVAVVTIKKASVDNSGLYKLIVENICGKQEDQVKVLVKGAPSAPVGPLKVSDITNDSCKLTWNPPEQDGNSKLLGYCIEKRDAKKSSWAFVTRTTTATTAITGLTDTSTYYFRVTAENAFGTGPALENKEPVQPIKIAETEKPKIKKAPEKEAGQVGDKLTLSVEFTAKPIPQIHWYKNGKELFDDVDSTITKMDKKTALTIQKLLEDDEGEYQVVVENEGGKAEHKFNVEVKSKPMIIDADKYKEPQVFDKGENVKLQLAFTGDTKLFN